MERKSNVCVPLRLGAKHAKHEAWERLHKMSVQYMERNSNVCVPKQLGAKHAKHVPDGY